MNPNTKSKGTKPVRPSWVLPAAVVLALVLALWGLWRWKRGPATTVPLPPIQASAQVPLFDPHDRPMTIVLKGVDVASGRFLGTKTVIRESKTRYNQMKQAVLAFLHGPREGKFQVPVPEGLELNQFYFSGDGMAVVDLSMAGVKSDSFGFYEEALFVRGIIETLTSNFFEVRQVKLLVDGQDAQVLGGHYALGTSEVNMPVSLSGSRVQSAQSDP